MGRVLIGVGGSRRHVDHFEKMQSATPADLEQPMPTPPPCSSALYLRGQVLCLLGWHRDQSVAYKL